MYGVGVVRRAPGQQLVQRRAEQIDVGPDVELLTPALDLLGRHERGRAALDALHHHHRAAALVGTELVDRHDIRMLERAGDQRLGEQPRGRHVGAVRVGVVQVAAHALDRDLAAEAVLAGQMHHAHATFAQHRAERELRRGPFDGRVRAGVVARQVRSGSAAGQRFGRQTDRGVRGDTSRRQPRRERFELGRGRFHRQRAVVGHRAASVPAAQRRGKTQTGRCGPQRADCGPRQRTPDRP